MTMIFSRSRALPFRFCSSVFQRFSRKALRMIRYARVSTCFTTPRLVGGRMRHAILARFSFTLFLIFALLTVATAQDAPKRAPSTAEERQRFVALTHKLEQNPLDKSLYKEKIWATKFLEDVPDINVTICAPILF